MRFLSRLRNQRAQKTAPLSKLRRKRAKRPKGVKNEIAGLPLQVNHGAEMLLTSADSILDGPFAANSETIRSFRFASAFRISA
jgi:hypothetical protein